MHLCLFILKHKQGQAHTRRAAHSVGVSVGLRGLSGMPAVSVSSEQTSWRQGTRAWSHRKRHQGPCKDRLDTNCNHKPTPFLCLTHRGLSQINRNKPSSFPEPAKIQNEQVTACPFREQLTCEDRKGTQWVADEHTGWKTHTQPTEHSLLGHQGHRVTRGRKDRQTLT